MITFTSAVGAMAMKLVATPIIQRFGFKRVLVWNALIAGVFVALCGLFRADTPIWIMARSEEHTSELQSLMRISYAVFCLKKKKTNKTNSNNANHNNYKIRPRCL